MKVPKKRCAGCRQWFAPDPRSLREGRSCQRYCSKTACRKARIKESQTNWLAKNPDYFKGAVHKEDCRLWAREHPAYQKGYRDSNPDYVQANRQGQRLRDKKRLFLVKKDEIAKNPLGHLESLRFLAQKNLVKKDGFRLPLEGILDFLVTKECLVKKEAIALGAPGG